MLEKFLQSNTIDKERVELSTIQTLYASCRRLLRQSKEKSLDQFSLILNFISFFGIVNVHKDLNASNASNMR